MSLLERLQTLADRYHQLTEQLSDPNIGSDPKRLMSLSREQSQLQEVYDKYNEYKSVMEGIEDAKFLIADEKDEEMREMAKEELRELEQQVEPLEDEIKILLIPKDPNDDLKVRGGVRGAAGGDEAHICAGD